MAATPENQRHEADPDSLPVADAPRGNWVDSLAPRGMRPYLRLARFDRPIGAWLLLWPCWWSVALVAREAPAGWRWAVTGAGANAEGAPDPILLLAFLIGAFAMRGSGCTYNDIVDRDLDRRVARTASRPIPSGQVSVTAAVLFGLVLGFVGLAVLLTFNRFAVGVGVVSLAVVAAYPFAKRVTSWPQVVLGLAFGWGALMGWAAATGALSWSAVALYAGCIVWIVGYDTIYAHMDKDDDVAVGVKSSALALGRHTKPALAILYALALAGVTAAAYLAGVAMLWFGAVAIAAAAQLAWQVADLDMDDPTDCLSKFRSNHIFGLLVFAALITGQSFGARGVGDVLTIPV